MTSVRDRLVALRNSMVKQEEEARDQSRFQHGNESAYFAGVQEAYNHAVQQIDVILAEPMDFKALAEKIELHSKHDSYVQANRVDSIRKVLEEAL